MRLFLIWCFAGPIQLDLFEEHVLEIKTEKAKKKKCL